MDSIHYLYKFTTTITSLQNFLAHKDNSHLHYPTLIWLITIWIRDLDVYYSTAMYIDDEFVSRGWIAVCEEIRRCLLRICWALKEGIRMRMGMGSVRWYMEWVIWFYRRLLGSSEVWKRIINGESEISQQFARLEICWRYLCRESPPVRSGQTQLFHSTVSGRYFVSTDNLGNDVSSLDCLGCINRILTIKVGADGFSSLCRQYMPLFWSKSSRDNQINENGSMQGLLPTTRPETAASLMIQSHCL